jgi:hypothetical protein
MQSFSVNGQLQRNHEVQKKARKSLGPDISSPQAVNDTNIPSRPSERCQTCLSQASTSRALHSEKRHFSLCADSSFNRPQSLPGSQSRNPFLDIRHTMDIGHVRERVLGKGGVGKAGRSGGENGGNDPKEKSESDLTPRHATGSRAHLARTSAAHPRCSPYLIRNLGFQKSANWSSLIRRLRIHSFRTNAKNWKSLIGRHSSFTKKIRTAPTPARLLRYCQLPANCRNFTLPLTLVRSCPRMRSGDPPTPLCRSWLVPELRGQVPNVLGSTDSRGSWYVQLAAR